MSLNVRNYNNKEMLLFPTSIGDYLSKDHLAWVIDDVVEQLDLSCLYKKVASVGNPSYHPKMMLKILFYGYATSTFSSRKIGKGTETDVAFIFLSGMQKPDFRTISDFRKNNAGEISNLFVQIVRLCKKLGLVGLGHISLDSTVIEANAYREKTYDREKLILEERAIEKKIKELLDTAQATDDKEDNIFGPDRRGDELPKELRSQEKRLEKIKEGKAKLEEESLKEINLTDSDVKFQRQEGNLIRPGYRAEIAVDEKEQIILSCDVINKANDIEQLIPLIEQTSANLPEASTKESIVVTADSGYNSMENLKKLESKQNIDAYIPDAKYQTAQRGNPTKEDSPFYKKHFIYNPKKDVYLCPNHKELIFSHRKKEEGENGAYSSVYRCRECRTCQYFGRCTKTTHGREIKVYDNIGQIYKMRSKLNTAYGKLIYGRRKVIVEPVFGNIKHNLGFRQFLLRGLIKVKAEFMLIAIVHNIKKIAKVSRKMLIFKPPGIQLVSLPVT
ncbi:MAG: IS1182 family transposase [Candidatus Omnitrophica bacterium]|nr:IS1182 family transposase [Candidatus Omnitrophota bacterium]